MPKDIQKMLDFDILEQITIIRQTLAPLRLTRWQMFKSVVSSVFRKMPTIAFLLSLSVGFAFVYILWKALNRPKDVEKLGMPILGGSKQHRNDFASIVEEGRRKVSKHALAFGETKKDLTLSSILASPILSKRKIFHT